MIEPIETSRLVLKPVSETLLPDFHTVWSDHSASFWSLRGQSKSIEQSRKLLGDEMDESETPQRLTWLVYLRDDIKECIGLAGLKIKQPWEPGEVEEGTVWVIGYMFRDKFWGKGYATECTRGLIDGIAPKIRPCTVQAYINQANPASIKVSEKNGFQLVEKIYDPSKPRVFVGGEMREYDVWRYIRRLN